jgi:hypothetical protein
MQRIKGVARSADSNYMNATNLYTNEIGKIIAKAQITNGGPVILLQPENEYTGAAPGYKFPDPDYMNAVYTQYRKAGIVLPYLSNDASPGGHNAPGQPAPVDIYGHDGYPVGFDCSNPEQWNPGNLATTWRKTHMKQSPHTPYAIPEFQGGSYDPWAGPGFEKCEQLTGAPFERVFYKNNYAAAVSIFNIYMMYGGTNWGNLGEPFGYTSYDYGAPIAEDRLINREKYSEIKLQANFLVASPQYLTIDPETKFTTGAYTTSNDLGVTRLDGNDSSTAFFVIRHEPYHTNKSVEYQLKLPYLPFEDALPLGGFNITLKPRDSKMIPVNYQVGEFKLAYSTAEIFTWKSYSSKTVLIIYSDMGAENELGIYTTLPMPTEYTPGVRFRSNGDMLIVRWKTSEMDQIVEIGTLHIYLIDRMSAYSMWVLPLQENGVTPYVGTEKSSAIIKGGYLIRTVSVEGSKMYITGDLNKTTELKILGGTPANLTELYFNGNPIGFDKGLHVYHATKLNYIPPKFDIPDLSNLPWKSIDSLPEIHPRYSDEKWTLADLKTTYNDRNPLNTPRSLYASDYGYHYGAILFRGTFKATGKEGNTTLTIRGGYAAAVMAFLDDRFIGSTGILDHGNMALRPDLSNLEAGKTYTITIVLDNMGHNENWTVGEDESKLPVGVMDYEIQGLDKSAVTWKIIGTLGAEDYHDRSRGPANEGGLWVERHGYHLPDPPTSDWKDSKGPSGDGLPSTGVYFFATSFDLDMPKGYDIPLAIVVGNSSSDTPLFDTGRAAYRLNFYVNGWNFGKYANDIGPQKKFPVPEGIWNYKGKNWLAVSAWNFEGKQVKVDEIRLEAGPVIYSGMEQVQVVESPKWEKRDAY